MTVARWMPGWALPWVAAMAMWPCAARGDVNACIEGAEEGQKLRDGGAYRRARERFIACAADECPGEVRKGCVGWLGELEKLMPTVVFAARAHGHEVSDVRVSVDGAAVAERIDGKPVLLDPGEHRFRFERFGEVATEETAFLVAGEKGRLVSARFGPEPPSLVSPPASPPAIALEAPPAPSPSRPGSTRGYAYALAAVGLVSLAAGVVLDVSGYTFLQACNAEPSCTGSHERAEVQWRFVTGDILLGASAAAGVAAWLLWPRDARAATHARMPFAIRPERTGATVDFAAVF